MSTIEGTDLFPLRQGGTTYKATAAQLKAGTTGDVVVRRGTANYRLNAAALATVGDTDILPVGRGGQPYQVSGAGLKAYLAEPEPELWTPADLPGAHWFDAQLLSSITLVDSRVSEWRSRTTGTLLTQGDSGLQGVINGSGEVEFRGGARWMLLSPDPGPSTILGALTLFGIAPNAFSLAVHRQGDINIQLATFAGAGTFYPFGIAASEWFWSGALVTPTPDWTTPFFPNPALGAPLAALWSANYPAWWGPIVFGSMGAGESASTAWNDIVIVPGPVTAEDRQRCEGFFAHKGSRTDLLPADHPYKATPPMQ